MRLDEFEIALLKHDKKDRYETYQSVYVDNSLEIEQIITSNFQPSIRAILGIDIYEYSQYSTKKQILVPIVLALIMKETRRWMKETEPALFFGYDFDQPHIDTGDGGFYQFDTPLQAILFNKDFQTIVRMYNTGHFYPSLRTYLGEIVLRTCITFDTVYYFNNNLYGSAIINNARILSQDKLNRLLIDHNSFEWFNLNTGGLESLSVTTLERLMPAIPKLEPGNEPSTTFMLNEKSTYTNAIVIVHIQKIGTIEAKKTLLSVYNVELQFNAAVRDEIDETVELEFRITIGNLNSEGLGKKALQS